MKNNSSMWGLALMVLIPSCYQPDEIAVDQPPMKLWYESPASVFEEALPIGNGTLGAVIYGGAEENLIHLNDITFWTGGPVDNAADAAAYKWIPQIREALWNEDYSLADELQHHVQGSNSQYYQPLATLVMRDDGNGGIRSYRRELDIDRAVCSDSYIRGESKMSREYFASNPDQAIVIHLESDTPGGICYSFSLTSQVPHELHVADSNTVVLSGHATGDPAVSMRFCTFMQVQNDGGETYVSDSCLVVRNADEVNVYITAKTSFAGMDKAPVADDYENIAAGRLSEVSQMPYSQIKERHIGDYRTFYDRVKLGLSGSYEDISRPTDAQLKDYSANDEPNRYLETLYFQYGRYLLVSCSRTPEVPANLQGLWAHQLYSPWRGNYTVNINLEENYWPAETANLPEMAEPLIGFVERLSENGKYTAMNYYGIERGWCSSHNSDIWAMTNPVGEKRESPTWSNWNLGGAWLCLNMWEHYLYSGDRQYLRERCYPLMRGAAEFCLDWLVENPSVPGELLTAPSTSPENEYLTPEGYAGATVYGGTADMAIIRELFLNTLQAAEILNVDKSLASEISGALEKLVPYKVGHQGNLQEWYHDWDDKDPRHRHQSHLTGLYPGHHLREPELMDAARKTLEIKGDESTGWSTGWRINLWARLGDAQRAYRIYRNLLKFIDPESDAWTGGGTYPNLFDAHPPFQIDGNFGGTAGVCEMLVQSHRDGVVELLPALPSEWNTGAVRGLRARGGYEVDFEWRNGTVTCVTVRAGHSGTVAVRANGITVRKMVLRGIPARICF